MSTWPANTPVVDAVFVTVDVGATATVAVDAAEVIVALVGDLPDAVAESWIVPFARSAAVTVYVAVQVTEAPMAIDAAPAGQVGPLVSAPAGAVWVSTTATLVSLTLPLFVTTKLYVTVVPAVDTVAGLAVFAIVRLGAWTADTAAMAGTAVAVVPLGVIADAVLTSLSEPACRSAAVTVCFVVQVIEAPGASDAEPGAQVGVATAPDEVVSVTAALRKVTLPVLVTTVEYVTTSPTAETVARSADLVIVSFGDCAAVTAVVTGGAAMGFDEESTPVAVAESSTEALFTSAWVVV